MRRLTERRAYLAAKQLAHHRERLPWMRERMEENERLLRERLEESGERRLVLPGGATPLRVPRTAGWSSGSYPRLLVASSN
jgi:hypothetical protein